MDKRGLIVIMPDGALPDVQIIFAANEGGDAFVKVEGKHYQLKAGVACLIHSLAPKLGVDEIMSAVLKGVIVEDEMESEGEGDNEDK